MKVKYFVSYYWRNSFFKRGCGWVEIVHDKEITSGDDILQLQNLIESDKKIKKVIVIGYQLIVRMYE